MAAVPPRWISTALSAALPGARLEAASPVPGGLSGDTWFLTLAAPGGEQVQLVAKRPGAMFGRLDARRTESEYQLLAAARDAQIPAPRPVYLGIEDGAILMERLPGTPQFHPPDTLAWARRTAKLMARLHLAFQGHECQRRLAAAIAAGLAQPRRTSQSLAQAAGEPDESLGETRIRRALAAAWPPPANPLTLVHGDIWPGNVIWHGGQVSGLIDWEDAYLGDPLEDLGVTRLDTWWQFGEEAMNVLTDHYLALVPWPATGLPVADLLSALRPCGEIADWARSLDDVPAAKPRITEEHMRAVHAQFVERAVAALA